MRFIGAVKTLKMALRDAKKIAKKEKRTVVIEKAKSKDPSGRLHTIYRGWLDLQTKKSQVITYTQWKKRRKR